MEACPALEILSQFMVGALPETTAAATRKHVYTCVHCQAALDHLSEDAQLHDWVPQSRRVAPPAEGDEVLLRAMGALRARPVAVATAETRKHPFPFLEQPAAEGEVGTLGPYRVLAELGRGGMGIVFQAYDPVLERTVALKVLQPELANGEARARFVREAQAAARVSHDHVVPVYGVANPPEGLPYLVMEYLAGGTLADCIQSRKALEPREAVAFVAQAAEGLAAAHAAGLIHRDIKPSNILLEPAQPARSPHGRRTGGRAKIMDFGLARIAALPSTLTQEGTLAGTPAYMSPEQAQGLKTIDARTDVYSLGVTLYEALTGAVPFRGTAHMVLQQVIGEEPRPPRRLNDRIPRDLETICLKAMAKEPARRYATARELADDLVRWQRGEPIRARPVGPVGRFGRWCRRNRLVASLLTALVLAIGGGFAAVVWQLQRVEAKSREADANFAEAERSWQQAHQVVHAFVLRVYDRVLLTEPANQRARDELLREALRYYQGLLQQRGTDPALRQEVAEKYLWIGHLTEERGNQVDGLAIFQQALAIYQELARDNPEISQFRQQLAACHTYIGRVQESLGRLDEALRSFQQARNLRVQLNREEPGDRSRRRSLANCLATIANLDSTQGRPAKAAAAYQKALTLHQELAREAPTDPTSQIELGVTYHNLGLVQAGAERLANLQHALEIRERLYQTSPNTVRFQHDLARTCQYLGTTRDAMGDHVDAAALLQRACNLLEQAARHEPGNSHYQFNLGQSYIHQSAVLLHADRLAEALDRMEHARTVMEPLARKDPQNVSFQMQLAQTYQNIGVIDVQLGRRPEAITAWKQMASIFQQLIRDHPEQIQFVQQLAKNHTYVGVEHAALRQWQEAIGSLQQACPLWAKLVEQDPANPEHRSALAETWQHLGDALAATGRPEEAVTAYLQAIEHQWKRSQTGVWEREKK